MSALEFDGRLCASLESTNARSLAEVGRLVEDGRGYELRRREDAESEIPEVSSLSSFNAIDQSVITPESAMIL